MKANIWGVWGVLGIIVIFGVIIPIVLKFLKSQRFAGAFGNRGNAYAKKKDYAPAIRDYNKAIEIDPTHAVAFNNGGNAYDDKKNAAIRDYNKAIEIDPNDALTMMFMGLAYKEKGDKEKARIWYEKALEKKEYLTGSGEKIVRKWLKHLEE